MPSAKQNKAKIAESYDKLLSALDEESARLSSRFESEVVCRAGCSACCKVPRSVLPLEAEYILRNNNLDKETKETIKKNAAESGNCPFLINDLCAVYPLRPVICRTHGLPLLYFFEEEERYAITHCELNFIGRETGFKDGEYLNMETINAGLRLLNEKMGYGTERISFSDPNFLNFL